ncbi:hypothetical protein OWM54_40905 [Myxococcus sp. MISCRS1]|jgi:hypothetical protein|uniref:Uncharacterized protein n=1 Tax=Myxococcus fulvus TaxID=33 RepID=A0A511TAF4_MYXFU|nr:MULTISPECIES: hypothetical protein [Myxococcus]AKF86221.1 hypothetical protein MFUL124B02_23400 [Myxococcus fulvus 124B02]BDT34867.1 hypothetical protein MFMH1_45360 [Myxococcus sp. MH1]MBZ4402192.1 hypothetical protein [Myxococcus sp. AS-1-15]MBZ4414316.1 hypothetical protein [Myxococcus sp. XM-1-1-1]MCK8499616.1 hypothetical protein [Myxococcus fulvus]
MPTVFSANRSSILVDGEAVDGLQSLAFRVVTEREDIRAIGSNERVDVIFGLRTVIGELVIRSAAVKLDSLLDARGKFQLVANLKRTEGTDDTRTLSFDDCFVESKSFQMDAHGSAATTYAFTATRLREE